jgi:hypothetical protein
MLSRLAVERQALIDARKLGEAGLLGLTRPTGSVDLQRRRFGRGTCIGPESPGRPLDEFVESLTEGWPSDATRNGGPMWRAGVSAPTRPAALGKGSSGTAPRLTLEPLPGFVDASLLVAPSTVGLALDDKRLDVGKASRWRDVERNHPERWERPLALSAEHREGVDYLLHLTLRSPATARDDADGVPARPLQPFGHFEDAVGVRLRQDTVPRRDTASEPRDVVELYSSSPRGSAQTPSRSTGGQSSSRSRSKTTLDRSSPSAMTPHRDIAR